MESHLSTSGGGPPLRNDEEEHEEFRPLRRRMRSLPSGFAESDGGERPEPHRVPMWKCELLDFSDAESDFAGRCSLILENRSFQEVQPNFLTGEEDPDLSCLNRSPSFLPPNFCTRREHPELSCLNRSPVILPPNFRAGEEDLDLSCLNRSPVILPPNFRAGGKDPNLSYRKIRKPSTP